MLSTKRRPATGVPLVIRYVENTRGNAPGTGRNWGCHEVALAGGNLTMLDEKGAVGGGGDKGIVGGDDKEE